MVNKDVEIEIKLPLFNRAEVAKYLNKNADVKAKYVKQKDIYYTPEHKDYLDAKHPYQYLRIRESKEETSFGYKHCHPEDSDYVEYMDEYETNVDDSKALAIILKNLDFKEILVVDKTRDIWELDDVEVVIDEVRDYGVFIELECKSSHSDPKKAKEYLFSVLKEFDAEVGDEDQDGYVFGILKKQGYKFGN